MDNLLSKISIKINSEVYVKDPESTELGKKILYSSIVLIDEIEMGLHFSILKSVWINIIKLSKKQVMPKKSNPISFTVNGILLERKINKNSFF